MTRRCLFLRDFTHALKHFLYLLKNQFPSFKTWGFFKIKFHEQGKTFFICVNKFTSKSNLLSFLSASLIADFFALLVLLGHKLQIYSGILLLGHFVLRISHSGEDKMCNYYRTSLKLEFIISRKKTVHNVHLLISRKPFTYTRLI